MKQMSEDREEGHHVGVFVICRYLQIVDQLEAPSGTIDELPREGQKLWHDIGSEIATDEIRSKRVDQSAGTAANIDEVIRAFESPLHEQVPL